MVRKGSICRFTVTKDEIMMYISQSLSVFVSISMSLGFDITYKGRFSLFCLYISSETLGLGLRSEKKAELQCFSPCFFQLASQVCSLSVPLCHLFL